MSTTTRKRLREFLSTIGPEEHNRYSGLGLDPDAILAEMTANYTNWLEGNLTPGSTETLEVLASEWDDEILWEGNRVVAVLRVAPDLKSLAVTRFDA